MSTQQPHGEGLAPKEGRPGAVSSAVKTPEERKQLLAQQIRSMVTQGARIESQSDFEAVLAEGKDVNHTLHAILTIFTCLIWGIVWAVIAGTGGVKRQLVTVDDYGNVMVQRIHTK